MKELYNRIIKFNYTFPAEARDNFLNGNCYWYARILQERFSPWSATKIMYNPIENHFSCRLMVAANEFYLVDARGIFATSSSSCLENWIPWDQYIKDEPLDAARVYRDCIWHLDESQWEALPQSFRSEPWTL